MIDVKFFPAPEPLADHISTIYRLEIDLTEGETVSDCLIPEWGNIRFLDDRGRATGTIEGVSLEHGSFIATGPTSTPLEFTIGSARIWGFGLLPLGWATYVGMSTKPLANTAVDGAGHAAFKRFGSLAQLIADSEGDDWRQYALISDWLSNHASHPRDEARVRALQEAMADPYLVQIPDFADRAGVSVRTLERLCLKCCGFSPNVILRRQRLIRSLASFIVDGESKWSETIDRHYHDQPHFVREFHQFMGMSPTEYAVMDHPIMRAFMENRQKVWGFPALPEAAVRAEAAN